MNAGLLGGDVAQIQAHAAAYRTFSTDLVACGDNVVSTTVNAVSGLQDQVTSAQAAVVSALDAVSQESRTVMAGFEGVMWTGANRGQVEQVCNELNARVSDTTLRVQDLFDTFRADLTRIGGELTDVADQFKTVSTAAGESAASLGQAMDAQAAELDQVMNTGITQA
jgi:di/tripeptidase